MVALLSVHHSTIAPHFPGGLGLLHQPSWLWNTSPLPPQVISPPPTVVPSLGPPSKHHCPAPNPSPHQGTHNPGWGV